MFQTLLTTIRNTGLVFRLAPTAIFDSCFLVTYLACGLINRVTIALREG